ncbi:MAG TPA: hypothetical protein VK957_16770, partial [Lunatimonas sp.]|nr:hypothetical protein [Lunatimonas sp.]
HATDATMTQRPQGFILILKRWNAELVSIFRDLTDLYGLFFLTSTSYINKKIRFIRIICVIRVPFFSRNGRNDDAATARVHFNPKEMER